MYCILGLCSLPALHESLYNNFLYNIGLCSINLKKLTDYLIFNQSLYIFKPFIPLASYFSIYPFEKTDRQLKLVSNTLFDNIIGYCYNVPTESYLSDKIIHFQHHCEPANSRLKII